MRLIRARWSIDLLVVSVVLCGLHVVTTIASADVVKGSFGRVVPIADDAHPNLYYDQSEVDELRNMILVQHSPTHLSDLYRTAVRAVLAVSPYPYSSHKNPHMVNMLAALSYMIEPTAAKAEAIRASLMDFRRAFPNGLGTWYGTLGNYFSGYSVPFMFDLLQAYHPKALSAADMITLKHWFAKSAQNLRSDTRKAYRNNDGTLNAGTTREGKTMMPFPNWFSRYMGPSLAAALVSGNQADVDYWADSGWPHDLFTTPANIEGLGLSSSVNRYDLVMYTLANYQSGANSDTYSREGFAVSDYTWNTTSYEATAENHLDGGAYHWAQFAGVILGAEMAYHNGMIGIYGITDAGAVPSILRSYRRAIQSRTEMDRRPTSLTGHPNIGYDPIIWTGYRRYSDPVIDDAVATLNMNVGFGSEMPNAAWPFLGYPRRIVWSSHLGSPSGANSRSRDHADSAW